MEEEKKKKTSNSLGLKQVFQKPVSSYPAREISKGEKKKKSNIPKLHLGFKFLINKLALYHVHKLCEAGLGFFLSLLFCFFLLCVPYVM